MKTAVRAHNRRFLAMCSHYLVEPRACTPVAGVEKGQVENQVGVVRRRFFSPRLKFKSYAELNAYLLDRCVAHAQASIDRLQKEMARKDAKITELKSKVPAETLPKDSAVNS